MRESGVALITAILIVALATTAVVAMMSRQNIEVRRTANLVYHDQAYMYVVGVEQLVTGALSELYERFGNDPDKLFEAENQLAGVLTLISNQSNELFPGARLFMSLEFPEGKFNLNSLVSAAPGSSARDYFEELLLLAKFKHQDEIEAFQRLDPELATKALIDWIDGGSDTDEKLDEDSAWRYDASERPYRTANQQLFDLSELRLIDQFSPAIVGGLEQYVTVLPTRAGLNRFDVDTPELLRSFDPNVPEGDIDSLIRDRDELKKFLEPYADSHFPIIDKREVFRVTVTVAFGLDDMNGNFKENFSVVSRSLLKRNNGDGGRTSVQWRSEGLGT